MENWINHKITPEEIENTVNLIMHFDDVTLGLVKLSIEKEQEQRFIRGKYNELMKKYEELKEESEIKELLPY